MLKAQDFEVEVIRELFTNLSKYAKFPNPEMKESVITLLKNLDDDLDAMDYGPSTGQNSVEEALEQLGDTVSEYEESLEDVDTEDDDKEDIDEDEDEPETPPATDKPQS